MIRSLIKIFRIVLIAAAWLSFIIAMSAAAADCAKTLAFSHFAFTPAAAFLAWLGYAPAGAGIWGRILSVLPIWLIFSLPALLFYAVAAGEFSFSSLRRKGALARQGFLHLVNLLKAAKSGN